MIRRQIDDTDSSYDKEKLQERLAKLAGGVAVINYTTDNMMIIPAILGAFVGTFIGMKYHIGDKIGYKKLSSD